MTCGAAGVVGRRGVAPGRAQGGAAGPGGFAGRGQFLDGHPAAIGAAGGQQLLHGLAMAVGLLVLEDDLVVGLQAQPVQALEDRGDGGLGRTLAIGVLDANKELPTRMACI
jgi:hypothetical protein